MNFDLRIVFAVAFLFYIYAFLSNPQLWFSISAKKFVTYTFFNFRIKKVKHLEAKALPKIFIFLPILREIYLIFFRFYLTDRLVRRRRKNYLQIYQAITKKRFNPKSPYLTAGDHFSSFYPRNLGFFYSKSLDPKTCTNITDYKNRLSLYLNSLAFALEFYEHIPLTTTIVPIFRTIFYPANVFREPSDTLCSLLLAFDFLIKPQNYNFTNTQKDWLTCQNQAKKMALELFESYELTLQEKVYDLLAKMDSQLGLIDKKWSLSGIRDGVKRKSSFYENVVLWKTLNLAMEMNLVQKEELEDFEIPKNLKKTILKNYVKNGIIYNDLKEELELLENFSADSLVANSLGFFNTDDEYELKIWNQLLDKIWDSEIITDFGIAYSLKNPKNLFFSVKLGAPSYMGKTVWSHWSVEFCLLLIDLYEKTKNEKYLFRAKLIFKNLLEKINKYKGYPEVYNMQGKIYQTLVYTTMLDTGWVVNFEYLRQKISKYL